jgi:UDP-N-acetylmuramate--alanine ligase
MSDGKPGPWRGRRLHFVGVGGAGMSGYARAAHALGAQISGSDAASTPMLGRLAADGVLDASIGHAPENVPDGEGVELFYSSAIPQDNVERRTARARGLGEHPRAQLLSELTALRRTLAVAGTHGKTTTASMLVHALRGAGLEPGWLVGAPIGGELPNAYWSSGEWLVVEADESDLSMLSLNMEIAVLTNVELDHHATFGSLEELRQAFATFVSHAREGIVVWDRAELLALMPDGDDNRKGDDNGAGDDNGNGDEEGDGVEAGAVPVVTYDVPDATLGPEGSRFDWRGNDVHVAVPGAHNALNAVAALEAARLAGAEAAPAIAGLARFHGAERRFQLLGRTARGALVYDDYAHHPTEVAATLGAARTLEPRRLVAVFQPHLYSRTESLAGEFGLALALADVVVVLDVYPARERAELHPGVSGLRIAEAAAQSVHGRPVYWLPTFVDAQPVLEGMLGEGDVCLVMGAGDVDALARALVGR